MLFHCVLCLFGLATGALFEEHHESNVDGLVDSYGKEKDKSNQTGNLLAKTIHVNNISNDADTENNASKLFNKSSKVTITRAKTLEPIRSKAKICDIKSKQKSKSPRVEPADSSHLWVS